MKFTKDFKQIFWRNKYAIGVEPDEKENKEIYAHYGFTEFIKSDKEYYPNGAAIDVEYYAKTFE